MLWRLFLASVLVLFGTLSLDSKEIELEYCEDPGPIDHTFIGHIASLQGASGWLNGEEFLSKRAITFGIESPLATGTSSMLPLCLDFENADSKKPSVLYVDANRNDTIDEGERYPLKHLGPGDHLMNGRKALLPNHLIAEKIRFTPVLCGEKQEVYASIVLSNSAYSFRNNASYYLFSIDAWGCRRGRVTLDGAEYEIILRDGNTNGVFDDYDKGNILGTSFPGDSITFIHTDSNSQLRVPLRRNVILQNKAFSIDVRDSGRKVDIEPVDTTFGTLSIQDPQIEMTLWNLEWGIFNIAPGESKKLPAGSWFISKYTRHCPDTGASCSYTSSGKMKAQVEAGEKTVLELETALLATVSASKRKGTIRLSLDMKTPDGASFRSYGRGRNKEDPFKGIPFMITNSRGEAVAQDFFEFG